MSLEELLFCNEIVREAPARRQTQVTCARA
jgi:hypothetical protein